ncbi:hypothetical protein C5167_047984 [Papaver somniferum]|uniref:Uncharacterized protein n=1 Tax=Papaver somniferum TaxID=3469 RepID=A0A4Y7KJE2_PAPSO|nr:hypothetical protein C5167_047984 [Papaver somniferum]
MGSFHRNLRGFEVSGSDIVWNELMNRLQEAGAKILHVRVPVYKRGKWLGMVTSDYNLLLPSELRLCSLCPLNCA